MIYEVPCRPSRASYNNAEFNWIIKIPLERQRLTRPCLTLCWKRCFQHPVGLSVEDVVFRIDNPAVDFDLIVKVGSRGTSCTTHVSYHFPAFNFLTEGHIEP